MQGFLYKYTGIIFIFNGESASIFCLIHDCGSRDCPEGIRYIADPVPPYAIIRKTARQIDVKSARHGHSWKIVWAVSDIMKSSLQGVTQFLSGMC